MALFNAAVTPISESQKTAENNFAIAVSPISPDMTVRYDQLQLRWNSICRASFDCHFIDLNFRSYLLNADGQVDMLNVIANTIGLPPGMPGLPAPTAAMQASAAASSGDASQWPEYPLRPVVADGAQHPPPSSLDKTFGSFGREAVGLITRCVYFHGLLGVCMNARVRRVFACFPGLIDGKRQASS